MPPAEDLLGGPVGLSPGEELLLLVWGVIGSVICRVGAVGVALPTKVVGQTTGAASGVEWEGDVGVLASQTNVPGANTRASGDVGEKA